MRRVSWGIQVAVAWAMLTALAGCHVNRYRKELVGTWDIGKQAVINLGKQGQVGFQGQDGSSELAPIFGSASGWESGSDNTLKLIYKQPDGRRFKVVCPYKFAGDGTILHLKVPSDASGRTSTSLVLTRR